MIAFRNRIAHGYDDISNDVVWTILNDHLPLLIAEATALLPEFSGSHEESDDESSSDRPSAQ
ncbi:MAG: DUF86 domain-containing protein [Thermomicrobiales bacterium]